MKSDPKAVIERELGRAPRGVEIKVVEETPTTMYLVLPPKPPAVDELSDEGLDHAADGICAKCLHW